MSPLLLAVDDGIATGNLNAADLMFLIGLIAAGLGALAYAAPATAAPSPRVRWAPVLVAIAVALIAFGLFLL